MELSDSLADFWTATWPWLSLAANAILAALLFFKSVTTDFITKYYIARKAGHVSAPDERSGT